MAGHASGEMQGQQSGTQPGMVSSCTARDCSYNQNMRCFATNGIDVKWHSDEQGLHADCNTFTRNQHAQA